MSKLTDYILTHSIQSDKGSDVVFFKVKATNDASADELIIAIKEHKGIHCELNPLDGNEHNYIDLGGWLDSQELALRIMGIGYELGLWDLLTPKKMLGEALPDDVEQKLAGSGLITIKATDK